MEHAHLERGSDLLRSVNLSNLPGEIFEGTLQSLHLSLLAGTVAALCITVQEQAALA